MAAKGIDPALEGTFKVKVRDIPDDKFKGGYTSEGESWKEVEVITLFDLYKIHLKDFDV